MEILNVVLSAAWLVGGMLTWVLFEYLLHRFAFHEMRGHGYPSRAHLEHHVTADWRLEAIVVLAWTGVLVTGFGWGALGAWLSGSALGWIFGGGWVAGYFFYEYQHALAHRRGPRNRWERWLRMHHFYHHFGHPMTNHGVLAPWWDSVFRTRVKVDRVRVPRRLAMPWLVDADGEILPEYCDDYELVGSAAQTDARLAAIDRVRAYTNQVPLDDDTTLPVQFDEPDAVAALGQSAEARAGEVVSAEVGAAG
jgi:hypothetical protein